MMECSKFVKNAVINVRLVLSYLACALNVTLVSIECYKGHNVYV